MKSQLEYKNNKTIKNVKRAAFISYQMRLKSITQQMIADELKISQSAVSRAIIGKSKINRVDLWLKENLGV